MGAAIKFFFVLIILGGILWGVIYFKDSIKDLPMLRLGNRQTNLNLTASGSATITSPARREQTEDIITLQKSIYEDFNKEQYERAIKDGKIVILNFYANWCPICRAEAPDIEAGLNALDPEKTAAFRVSYKDDQTNPDEEALADQFKIPYQHTKVILKDGKVVYKETIQWSKEDVAREVNKVL